MTQTPAEMMPGRRVLVESPFAGTCNRKEDPELYQRQVEYHKDYARACLRDCFIRFR